MARGRSNVQVKRLRLSIKETTRDTVEYIYGISCKNAGHNKMEPDCNGQVDDIIILESCRVSEYKHTRLNSVCGVRG